MIRNAPESVTNLAQTGFLLAHLLRPGQGRGCWVPRPVRVACHEYGDPGSDEHSPFWRTFLAGQPNSRRSFRDLRTQRQ